MYYFNITNSSIYMITVVFKLKIFSLKLYLLKLKFFSSVSYFSYLYCGINIDIYLEKHPLMDSMNRLSAIENLKNFLLLLCAIKIALDSRALVEQ